MRVRDIRGQESNPRSPRKFNELYEVPAAIVKNRQRDLTCGSGVLREGDACRAQPRMFGGYVVHTKGGPWNTVRF